MSLDGMIARGSYYLPRETRPRDTVIRDRSRLRRLQPKLAIENDQPRVHDPATSLLRSFKVTEVSAPKTVQKTVDFSLPGNRQTVRHEQVFDRLQDRQDVSRCDYHTKKFRVLYIFGLTAFVFAIFASIHTIYTNVQTKESVQVLGVSAEAGTTDETGVTQGNPDQPSEDPVGENAFRSYSVDNDAMRYLRIPSIEVNARVKSRGLDKNGAIEAPRNIYDVNWYTGSVLPGSRTGTSLISGHLSGWTNSGVFKRIETLKVGAVVEIERGDGRVFAYTVTKTEKKAASDIDMSEVLATEKADTHVLKLMTCAGQFDSRANTYKDRVIVHAVYTQQ